MIAPPPAAWMWGRGGLRPSPGRLQVEVDQEVPDIVGRVHQPAHRPVLVAAGVVDHDRQLAHLGDGPRDQVLDAIFGEHVGGDGEGAAAEGANLPGHLFDLVHAPGTDDDIGAGFGEGDRDPGADAAARAGDTCNLSIQSKEVEDAHLPTPMRVWAG